MNRPLKYIGWNISHVDHHHHHHAWELAGSLSNYNHFAAWNNSNVNSGYYIAAALKDVLKQKQDWVLRYLWDGFGVFNQTHIHTRKHTYIHTFMHIYTHSYKHTYSQKKSYSLDFYRSSSYTRTHYIYYSCDTIEMLIINFD